MVLQAEIVTDFWVMISLYRAVMHFREKLESQNHGSGLFWPEVLLKPFSDLWQEAQTGHDWSELHRQDKRPSCILGVFS